MFGVSVTIRDRVGLSGRVVVRVRVRVMASVNTTQNLNPKS